MTKTQQEQYKRLRFMRATNMKKLRAALTACIKENTALAEALDAAKGEIPA